MSLHPAPDQSVPDDTAAVARAVLPQGTACLGLRDRLGPVFADEPSVELFEDGQPAACPWAGRADDVAPVWREPFGTTRRRRSAQPHRWEGPPRVFPEDSDLGASVLIECRSRLVMDGAEPLRAALDALAVAAPDGLRAHADPPRFAPIVEPGELP